MTRIPDNDAYFREIAAGPWSEPGHPRRRAVAALVQLAARALDRDSDPVALDALADRLEDLADPSPGEVTRYRDQDRPAPDGSAPVRPNATGTHPLAGPCNPVAPPIALVRREGEVHGEVSYDVRFEGLPGLVQGGFLAAGFDLMLGQGVAMSGVGGMTGSISVRFRAPTPLYTPLRYRARFDRREGRKAFATAELERADDGELLADAEGIFIAPREPARP